MWPLDEASSNAAKWVTGVIGGLAIAWKIFLRVQRDRREDREGGSTTEGYELILDRQQEEIARCHARMHALEEEASQARRRADRAEVNAEQHARRAHAANEAVELFRAQIKVLEMDVQRLEEEKTGRGDNPLSPSVDR